MPARPGRDKRLYLIDGMPLVYRAYFVFLNNPLITANGFNSSAVFGYTTSLLQILTDEEPTHVAVVFDAPGPTWRTEEYADYKGTRAKAPEKLPGFCHDYAGPQGRWEAPEKLPLRRPPEQAHNRGRVLACGAGVQSVAGLGAPRRRGCCRRRPRDA